MLTARHRWKASWSLESAVLTAMRWASLADVPMGENQLTQDQFLVVLRLLNDPLNHDLEYSIGLLQRVVWI
ncbi:pyocin S6 family toxin immunity protein [Pseudomonas helmanticensis]|uniref:pyocin S6 family toxin immunity protein n=1 Tax=Pseudomonas helmanticensis TaxID=1471381 RepID=UPI003D27F3D2